MSGIEQFAGDKLIVQLLNESSDLTTMFGGAVPIYNEVAPREAVSPYLVMRTPTSEDVNGMDGARIFTDVGWSLQATVREGTYTQLKTIMDIVDNQLCGGGARVVDGVYVGRFIRTNVMKGADVIDQVRWFYLGAIYRAIVYGVATVAPDAEASCEEFMLNRNMLLLGANSPALRSCVDGSVARSLALMGTQ